HRDRACGHAKNHVSPPHPCSPFISSGALRGTAVSARGIFAAVRLVLLNVVAVVVFRKKRQAHSPSLSPVCVLSRTSMIETWNTSLLPSIGRLWDPFVEL